MFQFRRFPTYTYLIQCTLTEYCSAGFPHSEISGSTVICTYPKLIAACHVLHRLLMPRHSPCALISLTYFLLKKKVGKENFNGLAILVFLTFFLYQKKNVNLVLIELELCRLQRDLQNCLFYPFRYKKVPQLMFVSLCCLLFILLVTLFSFQGAVLT